MLVLIATGTDMAADRLGAWSDLTDTDYGERLLAKLGVVVIVIGLTLFHSLVQGPALSRLRAQALERPGQRGAEPADPAQGDARRRGLGGQPPGHDRGAGARCPPRDGLDPIATLKHHEGRDPPRVRRVHVRCTCGSEFTTRSTTPEMRLEICSECHPFYTGKQKLVDTGGRVERFQRRAAKRRAQH